MVTALIAFLLLGLVLTLLLYVAIESETSNTQILDRETAEEEAKRRGGIDPRKQFGKRNTRDSPRDGDTDSSDGWGDRDGDWGTSGSENDAPTRDDDW